MFQAVAAFQPEFQQILKLVEPVWPSSWMSSDPFYSILPNLYKSKPIWPHFMQLFGPNFGPRKTLELASKHLLVWFINVGSFKLSNICRCWTTSNCLQSNNPTARNQYVHFENKLSAISYSLYVPKRGILCVGWLKY